MNRLEKFVIINEDLLGYDSPVLLVKWKQQNLYGVHTELYYLNDKLIKSNDAFFVH